jgi:hypothetical protein
MPIENYRGYEIQVATEHLKDGNFTARGTIRKLSSGRPLSVPFETPFAITGPHLTEESAVEAALGLAKTKIDDHIYIDKIEQLSGFFSNAKPGCDIAHDWTNGFEHYRFYFRKDRADKYALDMGRELLDDWSVEQIVSHLRDAGWESVLERHSGQGQALLFTRAGFVLPSE